MSYEVFYPFLLYLAIALFFLIVLPILGRLNFISKEFYHNIILINDFFSYKQYLFWILLFPFGLWLISIVLYLVGFNSVENIWISTILFWGILYVYIVFLLGRELLLSKRNFIVIALVSALTTFIFNKVFYSQGLDFLLPQNSIWFWTILFAFVISSFWYKHKTVANNSTDRIQSYLQTTADKFREKYKELLEDLSDTRKNLFLAIIIVENYNRPKFIRIFERLLSYSGLAKTTGLAQISKIGLTDLESTRLLKNKIKTDYKKEDFNLNGVRDFLKDYNGTEYAEMVLAVLQNLDKRFIER